MDSRGFREEEKASLEDYNPAYNAFIVGISMWQNELEAL